MDDITANPLDNDWQNITTYSMNYSGDSLQLYKLIEQSDTSSFSSFSFHR